MAPVHPRVWCPGKCDKLSFLRVCLLQMASLPGSTSSPFPGLMIGANLNSDPLNCGIWIRDQARRVRLTVYGATASSSDPAGGVRRTSQAPGDGQL